jgi:Flp pilus assembly protein TadD
LAILERLGALEPTNTDWQRELGVAYGRVGDLAQTRGDLAGAERASAQCLAILERLGALEPTNTDWQYELGVAYGRVGDLAQTRGRHGGRGG